MEDKGNMGQCPFSLDRTATTSHRNKLILSLFFVSADKGQLYFKLLLSIFEPHTSIQVLPN